MTGLEELSRAVQAASGRPEITHAVEKLYGELARRIDERKPVCQASGRCCRFEEFGHRLYVTTLELVAFVGSLKEKKEGNPRSLPLFEAPGGCPFQLDGLCSVHPLRPFGCRVFFCDQTSTQWQHEQYEQLHAQLKELHARLGVAYFYVEWRQALASLGL